MSRCCYSWLEKSWHKLETVYPDGAGSVVYSSCFLHPVVGIAVRPTLRRQASGTSAEAVNLGLRFVDERTDDAGAKIVGRLSSRCICVLLRIYVLLLVMVHLFLKRRWHSRAMEPRRAALDELAQTQNRKSSGR